MAKATTNSPRRAQFLIGGAVVALLLMYIAFPSGEASSDATAAAPSHNLRANRLMSVPARMEFVVVTDLDKKSLVDPLSKKPRWKAFLKKASGNLSWLAATAASAVLCLWCGSRSHATLCIE